MHTHTYNLAVLIMPLRLLQLKQPREAKRWNANVVQEFGKGTFGFAGARATPDWLNFTLFGTAPDDIDVETLYHLNISHSDPALDIINGSA